MHAPRLSRYLQHGRRLGTIVLVTTLLIACENTEPSAADNFPKGTSGSIADKSSTANGGALSSFGSFVFTGDSEGTSILGFGMAPVSGLTALPGSPIDAGTAGEIRTLAVHPEGKFLYAIVYHDNASSILGYARDADGTVILLEAIPHAANGPGNQLLMHPSGKYLYLKSRYSDSRGDEISGYLIDQNTGTLAAMPGNGLPSGGQFGAISPNGNVICMSHYSGGSGRLYTYQINPATGELSNSPGSPVVIPGSLACSFERSGRFVYAGLYNEGLIEVRAVNPETGQLGPRLQRADVGEGVVKLVSHPTKNVLYTISAIKNLEGFGIDEGTGLLTTLPGSPFFVSESDELQLEELAIDRTGNYLFAVSINPQHLLHAATLDGSGTPTFISETPPITLDSSSTSLIAY